MNRIGEYEFDRAFESSLLGELKEFQNRNRFIVETVQLRTPSLKGLNAAQYLSSVESNIPEELISSQNYREMKNLASSFNGSITSFFGFETRMNNFNANSDFLFAVSSQRGEREALANLFTTGKLPKSFLSMREWKNIGNFVTTWADPFSDLYNKILGLWFEFDIVNDSAQVPIPCVFLHTIPLQINNPEDIQSCDWLTRFALPLLTGQALSQTLEHHVFDAIRRLPKGASVFQIGVMLSRSNVGVRLVFNKILPADIIPYLKKLGWSDKDDRLSLHLEELERQGTRIILHINIGENGVDQKIGLECSFYPFLFNFETKWQVFLNYLVKKGLCLGEKKDALLCFPGVKQEEMGKPFDLKSYMRCTSFFDNDFSSALVRYISHIKLVYMPNHPIEAKVYSGVRLFGSSRNSSLGSTEGIY